MSQPSVLCGVWTQSCPGRVAIPGMWVQGCAAGTGPAQHAGLLASNPSPPSKPAAMTHVPASQWPAVLVSCGWWRPGARACAASLWGPQDHVSPGPGSVQTLGSWWWGTVIRAGSQGRSRSLRGAGCSPLVPASKAGACEEAPGPVSNTVDGRRRQRLKNGTGVRTGAWPSPEACPVASAPGTLVLPSARWRPGCPQCVALHAPGPGQRQTSVCVSLRGSGVRPGLGLVGLEECVESVVSKGSHQPRPPS